jgi:transcriptional regulator with XRE-family HTH domain
MAKIIDGVRFRKERLEAGFKSQAALAKAVGVWPNTIGRIERSQLRASADLLRRLAKALKKDLAFLLVEEDALPPIPRDLISAQFRGLTPHHQDILMGLIVAFQEGVELDRAFDMAKVYAKLAERRRVSETDAAKLLFRRP